MHELPGLLRARALLEEGELLRSTWEADRRAVVSRWGWASRPTDDPEPLHELVHPRGPAEPLPAEPRPPVPGATRHGYDAEGRLVITLEQTARPDRLLRSFWFYTPAHIERVSFDAAGRPLLAAVYTLDADGVARIDTAWAGSEARRSRAYERQDGRIQRILASGADADGEAWRERGELEHDPDGVARVWWVDTGGQRSLAYERTSDVFARHREALRDGLVAAIAAQLRALPRSTPIAAIALWSYDPALRLPPRVGVASAEDLAGARFVPRAWRVSLRVTADEALAGLLERANRELVQRRAEDEAHALLAEVARRLYRQELGERADALVIWATEVDRRDPVDDLRAQLTPSELAALREAGLLR